MDLGDETATISCKINPTASVIPIKNGLIYTFLLSGLSKGGATGTEAPQKLLSIRKTGN